MTTAVKTQDSVTALQSICYALPVIPSVMLLSPMGIIQGVYAKYYGLALGTLATIILASRILDAISDPIIGYYSDQYRQRYGTLKPLISFGGLSLIACGYFLYVPTSEVTSNYFAFWSIVFYIAYTFFEIPHMTWPSDIVRHSENRAKLFSYRVVSSYLGMVFFYCVPLLPLFSSNEITPQTLQVTFSLAALITLPFLFMAMRIVPRGNPLLSSGASSSGSKQQFFRQAFIEFKDNKPFLIFMLAFLFGSFAAGMWYGLIYIYVDAYLGMAEQFAKMFLIAFLIGILVTPLWYKLALMLGKIKTWTFAIILMIISFVYTGMLNPEETSFTNLLILKVVQTCSFVCTGMIAPSMLSDIIDYSHWKYKIEKSATYFSMKVFLEKTSNAFGAALSLAIAGWLGFDISASGHSTESILGLKMAIAWMPALLATVGLIFVVLSPIDERRHKIVRKRLDARLSRQSLSVSTSEAKTFELQESPVS